MSPYAQGHVLLPLMVMNLELGQTAEFKKLAQQFGQNISYEPGYMAMLVRYDKLTEAKNVFDVNLQNNNNYYNGSHGSIRYSEELEQRIPAFLELLSESDEQFIAEFQLKSILDPGAIESYVETGDSKTPRRSRIADIAARFADVDFATDEMREAMLSAILGICPQCATENDGLRKIVTQLSASYKASEIQDNRNPSSHAQLTILASHVRSSLKARDTKPLIEFIDELLKNGFGEDFHSSHVLSVTLQPVAEIAQQEPFGTWDPNNLTGIADSYRKLYALDSNVTQYLDRMFSSMVAVHVATGEYDAFAEAVTKKKTQDEAQKEMLRRMVHRYVNLEQLLKMLVPSNGELPSLERRVELAAGLLRCLGAVEQLQIRSEKGQTELVTQHQTNVAQAIIDSKLLSRDELLASASVMSKWDGGYGWAAVATLHENAARKEKSDSEDRETHDEPSLAEPSGLFANAIEAWTQAIASSSTKDVETRFRLTLSKLYRHLGRKEEARRIIMEQQEVPKALESDVKRELKSLGSLRRHTHKFHLAFASIDSQARV